MVARSFLRQFSTGKMRLILPALIPVKTVKGNVVQSNELDSAKTVLKRCSFEQQEMEHNVNSTVWLLSMQKKKSAFLCFMSKERCIKMWYLSERQVAETLHRLYGNRWLWSVKANTSHLCQKDLRKNPKGNKLDQTRYLTQTPSFGKQIRKDHLF